MPPAAAMLDSPRKRGDSRTRLSAICGHGAKRIGERTAGALYMVAVCGVFGRGNLMKDRHGPKDGSTRRVPGRGGGAVWAVARGGRRQGVGA